MMIQDHRDAPPSSTLVTEGNAMSLDTGEQVLTGEGHAPKIRKPYTITKQRERWTEEEHNKFLEALKLYGRAWRKIEDHVGTKNAVQIRSHAQKFFSKVGRESSNGDTSFIKTIEIPPPRPKRKPAHPYPRKFVPPAKQERPLHEQSARSTPLHEQSARSTSLNSSVDQENQSPTSVLSAVPSETLGSAYSNTGDGSSSPVSSVDDGNYTALPHENDPSGQENISQSDEPVPEKLDLFPKDDAFHKGGSVEATSSKRIKLFGKTLSLPDSDEPATSSPCSSKTKSLDTSEGSARELADSEVANADNALGQCSPGMFPAAWYHNANSLMPYWAFYGNVPFPFVPMNIVNYTKVELHDKVTQREGSESGLDKCDMKSGVASQSHERFLDFIPCKSSSSEKITRGFGPYKKSLSERETISSTMTCEENETHRIRLSL